MEYILAKTDFFKITTQRNDFGFTKCELKSLNNAMLATVVKISFQNYHSVLSE